MLIKKRSTRLQVTIATLTLAVIFLFNTFTSFAINNNNSYFVKQGDSLYSIAVNHNLTVNDILSVNSLSSSYVVPGQKLYLPSAHLGNTPLADIFKWRGIYSPYGNLKIKVDKSDHTLTVYYKTIMMKQYRVDIGEAGYGAKQVRGDNKTPQGTYYITEKSVLTPEDYYLGTRWMRLSYPNINDAKRGLNQGIISKSTYNAIAAAINSKRTPPQNTPLGGAVGIHGGAKPGFGIDWTWGCVGLNNNDVEDFYSFVTVGTPVIIQL